MCMGCAAGAMTAVAGASGSRMWLEARFPALAGPRTAKIVRRTILGAGVLAAGVLGPSAHGPSASTGGASAAPVAVVQHVGTAAAPGAPSVVQARAR
jgi:hypothetical protein